MASRIQHFIPLLALFAVLVRPAPARAWVETRVRSYVATIDVSKAGQAFVSHELVLRVRGGPLSSLALDGVEPYTELLPDARVVDVGGKKPPVPLSAQRSDDGTLLLEVDHEKGLRAGVYLFSFRYKTDLLGRKLLVSRRGAAELTWFGPRLQDGVDSVRVVFRVPPAKLVPHLPVIEATSGADSIGDEFDGVLLSQVRRTADKDEVELVRPHVAKGEPATFRIQLSPEAFTAFSHLEQPSVEDLVGTPKPLLLRQNWLSDIPIFLLSVVYFVLLSLRWRFFDKACKARGMTARPLVPLPPLLRMALSALLLALAIAVGQKPESALVFGLLLLVSLLLATLRRPAVPRQPRGPGKWVEKTDSEAFDAAKQQQRPHFLDTSSVTGFVLFTSLLSGEAALAYHLLSESPYHALLTLLSTVSLMPIFFTGRASDVPRASVVSAAAFLPYLARRLRVDRTLQVKALARFPVGQAKPDELRLWVVPKRPKAGLVSIEVGLEHPEGFAHTLQDPFVLVRVVDDSEAYHALSPGVTWMRGRTDHERVSILRPQIPSRRLCAELIHELCMCLKQRARPASRAAGRPIYRAQPRPDSSLSKLDGSSQRTSKGAIGPAEHAT